VANGTDLGPLIRGDKTAWDGFVRRYAGLLLAAVRAVARDGADIDDLVQEVFARLCKDDFRLLKTYDPTRAGLTTWLTIVARSTARDALRRHHIRVSPIDDVPEAQLAVEDRHVEPIKFPDDLLSPRQKLVLTMLYERDMEVTEIAAALKIDPQTVRSTHHKAMLKLRTHFAVEGHPDKPEDAAAKAERRG
jgi:RNA polymerase sigma factor (sigma-70 family)